MTPKHPETKKFSQPTSCLFALTQTAGWLTELFTHIFGWHLNTAIEATHKYPPKKHINLDIYL